MANALCFKAGMYMTGRGYMRNVGKAQELYKEAADKGHPESQYRFAMIIIDEVNENTPEHTRMENYKIALRYLKDSANQNHPGAMTQMGIFLEKGVPGDKNQELISKDLQLAIGLFTNAANEF